MSNVRFYRLSTLPSFDSSKHQGIFVHLIPTEGETHKAGLWFGGAAGWEYLTNDTDAIDAAIDAKIQGLDVGGYAQAEISNIETETERSSTLTIYGIQEVNGLIGKYATSNFGVAIDGVYNNSSNKIATQDTVTNAINGLDVETVQPVTITTTTENSNTTLTFKGVKEIDGKIYQGDDVNPSTLVVGDAKLQIKIGSTDAFEVFSANAQENKVIQLNGNVFKKEGDIISVITPTPVSDKNRLVTEKDVANLAGAMHYKGTISSKNEFNNKLGDSDVEEAGDVYIATGIPEGSFTDNKGNVIENGDMIVFNGAGEYNVVQSNLTLGINSGQIAKNDGNLTPDNMVIATSTGIKTIGISETDLTGTTNGNNTRTLTYGNGTADTSDATLFHSATITDTFKVIGKDFTKSINISSANRSIEIARNAGENDSTGILVDLVWNTSIE